MTRFLRVAMMGAVSSTLLSACRPTRPATIPAPASTRVALQQTVDSVLGAPMWRNARWGMLVVDAASGDTLVSHDADRLFMPASNQKLLTGAIALHLLGPDYRWRTPVLLHGTQAGGVFRGRVLVQGMGDPSVSDAMRGGRAASAFDPIVQALRARGITQIVGSIEAFGDAMPGLTTGYGWAWDDFDAGYSAAIDELLFNEGELYLRVRAGAKPGDAVTVDRAPTRGYPPLRVDARTTEKVVASVPPGGRPPRVQAAYDSIGHTVVVSGALAVGDSARLTIAYRHPNDAFLAAMHETLADAGVLVSATALTVADTSGRALDTLSVLESPRLAEVLRRMEKPSQNQMAELFFRTTALAITGSGSTDSAQALGARTLAGWGIDANDIAYRDGSGLSRHDYVTPRAIIKVLEAMRTSPHAAIFRESLPIAGVDGTISSRMRGTPAQGNVRAKTGTLDKTRSLSGYVTTADGRTVLFSLLCNNFTVPNREVERVQDLLATMLASRPLGRGATIGPRAAGTR